MPHLISATLSEEAYKVYCRWKSTRSASAKISLAMSELEQIQELNEALITQLNIHKSRWKWLNENLPREISNGEHSGQILLEYACQHDHLYYRRD